MPVHSRNKGQRGERELFAKLSELLGFPVERDINARAGDCDSKMLPGWAPEVKRVEDWREDYWTQACAQAGKMSLTQKATVEPVLFHRNSRKPWSVFIDAGVITRHLRGVRVQLTLEGFARVYQQWALR